MNLQKKSSASRYSGNSNSSSSASSSGKSSNKSSGATESRRPPIRSNSSYSSRKIEPKAASNSPCRVSVYDPIPAPKAHFLKKKRTAAPELKSSMVSLSLWDISKKLDEFRRVLEPIGHFQYIDPIDTRVLPGEQK